MEYRRLGSSGLTVSQFALGCWPFEGGRLWGHQERGDSIRTVHAALAAGITLFDTAESYVGEHSSEEVLGEALDGRRGEALIATKVSAAHLASADLVAACDGSLKRLRTDRIDLFQVHWPNPQVPVADTVGALARLQEAGKVRAVGVCNFGPLDLAEFAAHLRPASDQLPYSLLWRPIEREVQPALVRCGIGAICYSPLAQGLLAGRYRAADEVPEGVARSRLFRGTRPQAVHGEAGCEDELFAALDRVRRIAAGLGQPMATVSLAWVRRQPAVAALLVGARTPEEVALNRPAFEWELPADAAGALAAATEAVQAHLGASPDMWQSPGRMR